MISGTSMEYVYIIEKGSVKLGMIASCGKTLTKDLVYDHEVFGENIFSPGSLNKEFC